jgi:ribosomal protein S18 acetylase RimI-like enzyme
MIRKATRADRSRISEIRFAVRENRPSNPVLIELLVDWLFDNSTFWVWEEDGAIQGFSAADPRDGSICALFVHPSYERRGIGRALLPLACDVLKETGHATAVLTTEAGTRGERFYRTDGWTEVGRKEDSQIIFQKNLLGSWHFKLRPQTDGLIIRPATTTDRPRLRQAIIELQNYERTLHTTRLPGEQVADAYLDWMLGRAKTKGAVLIADSNGIFAGFVAGWIEETGNVGETPDSNRVGYISDICIMPGFRGRRIATQLLKGIERHLARFGIARIRINSLAENKSARVSYEHAGFAQYEIVYEKTLGTAATRTALRPARPEDFDYCARLYFEGMEKIIKELNLDGAAQIAGFRQRWDVKQVRIVTLDGADTGWLQSFVKDDALFLGQLFVDGSLRGQGIGTELVKGLIGEAACAGLAVTLEVAKINPALRFYERLGFRATHEDEHKFYMRRDLRAPS